MVFTSLRRSEVGTSFPERLMASIIGTVPDAERGHVSCAGENAARGRSAGAGHIDQAAGEQAVQQAQHRQRREGAAAQQHRHAGLELIHGRRYRARQGQLPRGEETEQQRHAQRDGDPALKPGQQEASSPPGQTQSPAGNR